MTQRVLTREEAMICAVHEAGHCVAAVVLEIDFDYVTVIPEGECMGHTAIKDPLVHVEKSSSTYRLRCEEALVQAWAGSFAEHTVGGLGDDVINSGNGNDLAFIHYMTNHLGNGSPDEAEKINYVAGQRCHDLIVLCKEMIELVARRLFRVGKLTRDQVFEVLREHPIELMRQELRNKWRLQ